MLRTDDVERLSRLRAGELTEAEAKAVHDELRLRPELQRALQRLERLDRLAALAAEEEQEPSARDAALAEAIVRRVHQPPVRTNTRRGLIVAIGALAAAAAIIVGVKLFAEPPSTPRDYAAPPIASAPPKAPRQVQTPEPPPPSADEITIYGGAFGGGMIFWTPETKLARAEDGSVDLTSGTVIAQTQGGTVRVQDVAVTVDGEAVISTEPENAFAHVTRALAGHPGGNAMKQRLEVFRTAQAAWVGAALVVFTLDGEARAAPPKPAAIAVVKKGSSWSRGSKAGPANKQSAEDGRTQQALEGAPQKTGAASPQSVRSKPARVVDGQIELREVHAVVLDHSYDLLKCFTAAQAQSPNLSGAVTLQLAISTEGKLAEGSIDEAYTLQNPFVSACVLQKLSALQWPKAKNGVAHVSYPLGFEMRGSADAPGASLVFPKDAVDPEGKVIGVANADREKRAEVRANGGVTLGAPSAPVTVVEFSEFECTFCAKAWPVAKQLQAKYGEQVRVVFRHRPLPRGNARLAAQASLAAAEQGRFWEYGDLLFAHPDAHDRAALEGYAAKLGLDLLRFREAMDSERVAKQIDADLAEADRIGAKGVPTFFVNGREIVGARPIDQYTSVIDEELSASER